MVFLGSFRSLWLSCFAIPSILKQHAQLPQRTCFFAVPFPDYINHPSWKTFTFMSRRNKWKSTTVVSAHLFPHASCGHLSLQPTWVVVKHARHLYSKLHAWMTKKLCKHTNKWKPYVLIHQINWKCLPVDCRFFSPLKRFSCLCWLLLFMLNRWPGELARTGMYLI